MAKSIVGMTCTVAAIQLAVANVAFAGSTPSVFAGTMADMTYVELDKAIEGGAVALWAIGAIEEHGPHLPLATDVYIPSVQLLQIQKSLADRNIASVIVPPYYWGVNRVTGAFPGSIDIRPEVMTELMKDVFRSLTTAGFKQVYCITGHYDAAHSRAIIEAVRASNNGTDIRVHYVVPKPLAARVGLESSDAGFLIADVSADKPPAHPDLHAGEAETSMLLSAAPDVVRKELIASLEATDLTSKDVETWRKGYEDAKRVTPLGYLGDPASADATSGALRLKQQATAFAEAIAASVSARR
ncbi:creatininase family protein [Peristeroidobacter agariperforans]|uniref:creatininase family protein n=1 Tax=Peristeroidobacter agariperforans TaxID=268404 RepID=UPI0013003F5B|nr:creatininase family protein [Peristeroidobacter agariperforans]